MREHPSSLQFNGAAFWEVGGQPRLYCSHITSTCPHCVSVPKYWASQIWDRMKPEGCVSEPSNCSSLAWLQGIRFFFFFFDVQGLMASTWLQSRKSLSEITSCYRMLFGFFLEHRLPLCPSVNPPGEAKQDQNWRILNLGSNSCPCPSPTEPWGGPWAFLCLQFGFWSLQRPFTSSVPVMCCLTRGWRYRGGFLPPAGRIKVPLPLANDALPLVWEGLF